MSRKILLLIFLVNLLLLMPFFLPSLSEINPWDEANYVNKGRELIEHGDWPNYAGSPLVSIFYGLTYLPFHKSPFWLIHSDSVGRVLLFSLIWWSAVLVSGRFKNPAVQGVTVGLLFVTPLAGEMITFPSDPLFAGLAALSLWQLTGYLDDPRPRRIALGSLCLGLAALARNDGLVLFPIFFLLALGMTLRVKDWRRTGKAALAALLPFSILVGGYVLIYGLFSGDFRLGTTERAYLNFEAGQQVFSAPSGETSEVIESRSLAQVYFGTAQENDHSILRAIKRNPQMYLERLKALIRILPERLLHAYGIRFGALLFLLAIYGTRELFRQKQYWLLTACLLWPTHLATGFAITLVRPGHLQFPFYIIFCLAALGLVVLVEKLLESAPRRLPVVWGLILVLAIWGFMIDKLAVYYGAAVLFGALLVIFILRRIIRAQPNGAILALFILGAGGLILHGDYPSPERRVLGSEAKEQAVLFLNQHFVEDTLVAASSPGPVWMARMRVANLTSTDIPLERTPEAFVEWLRDQGVQAVFVDQTLSNNNPTLWRLLEAQIGIGLERIFTVEQGDIQVLLVR